MLDGLLQDDFAALEGTCGRGLQQIGQRVLTHIVLSPLEDTRTTSGTGPQRHLFAKVDQLTAFERIAVFSKIKLELPVLLFFIEFESHLGAEGPTRFGAKTIEWANAFVGQEGIDLGQLEGPPSWGLAKGETTPRALSIDALAGVAPVIFFDLSATLGAGCGQRDVVARDGVLVVLFGFFDNVLGHVGDVLHERLARQLAVLHQGQFVFPLTGEFGLGELLNTQTPKQRHQLKRLGCGNQFAAIAQHVFFIEQTLNGGGTRCRGSEPLFLHGLSELIVFDGFARPFHGPQEGRLRKARGWAGFERLGLCIQGLAALARLDRHQGLGVGVLVAGIFAVNAHPAGVDQHLAFDTKVVRDVVQLDLGGAGGHQKLGRGVKNRHEAPHHQVIELLLGLGQALGLFKRWDDGKVITHFAVVKDALGGLDVVALESRLGVGREVFHATARNHLKGVFDRGQVIFGQMPRIGPGVGQGLVALIETLGQRQGGFGGKTKATIGLALQRGEVKQSRGRLGGGFALLGDLRRLVRDGLGDGVGVGLAPDAIGFFLGIGLVFFMLGVDPLGGVLPRFDLKVRVNFPIVARDEFANLLLAHHHHRQGGRLHAAHGGEKKSTIARIEGREGTRAIDPHQPVGLRARARRIGQALHLLLTSQRVKAVSNGLRRHGLQPQAFDRFFEVFLAARVLLNQAKNEFAFAPCVTGVDQGGHVFAFDQFHHRVEPGLGLVHGFELKMRWDHRQMRKTPLAAFDIKLLGRFDLEQMTHGAGDHIGVTLKMILMFFKLARHTCERAHNVLRDRWFLSNYQCFTHSVVSFMHGIVQLFQPHVCNTSKIVDFSVLGASF